MWIREELKLGWDEMYALFIFNGLPTCSHANAFPGERKEQGKQANHQKQTPERV